MGYYTRYELLIDHPKDDEIMGDLRATNENANFALTEDGNANEDAKWYDHEEELLEFSKKYPDALFTMWGIGETNDDYWKHYVRNGKGQLVEGEIVYPPLDLSQL